MHRHEALRPLSRGHQPVLFHAREMKHDPAGALPAFLDYAREGLVRHIEAEERVLFPALLACMSGGEAGREDPSLVRALAAHAAIRAAVAHLGASPPDAEVRALARLLHDHVRDEERTLFPLAERVLGEEGLAAVARGLGGAFAI